MSAPATDPEQVRTRWQGDGAGRHYRTHRWRGARATGRDPALVAKALERHAPELSGKALLDVPCGAGRLRETLLATDGVYTGLDVSASMLEAGTGPGRIRASAWALPFPENTFAAVVCCRLLHHLAEGSLRVSLLAELLRVCRGPVIVSFWDATSWHAWRRRQGLRKARHPDSRVALSRAELEAHVREAGGRPLQYLSSFRFISQQTFLVLGGQTGSSR